MKTKTIENILKFLEENENKKTPQEWVDLKIKFIKKFKLLEELENHPDGAQYKYYDNWDLSGSNVLDKKIKSILPNNLYVQGSLWLADRKLTKLPDKLHVEGKLIIWDSNITELPDYLYVGLDLIIENIPLAKKYTNEQIREIVTSTGGQITGKILRTL